MSNFLLGHWLMEKSKEKKKMKRKNFKGEFFDEDPKTTIGTSTKRKKKIKN